MADLTKEELFQDVEEYAAQQGLTEQLPLLKKGALVAQSPHDYEHLDGLTEGEIQALREETTHRWKHPKMLYFTIAMNSIGAAIQGWDQTGSNGANLSFPQAFGIEDTGTACAEAGTCERNSWIIGVINSMPYMTIALL